MSAPIPLVDLAVQHAAVADEVQRGWEEVLRRGAFVGGEEVGDFESQFAAFSGVGYCVGVANGTDALEMSLRALGIGAGDEVLLPANSFIASAFAVLRCGARPVLADVDPDHLLLEPAEVERRRTSRCRVVMPVHLFGQMAPMAALGVAAPDALVIEDAAQAQGASQRGLGPGAHGALAATSFYPGKNLGAYGDAGAVLTDDQALADRVRRMGSHGSARRYEHLEVGFNSRLDTLQAVVLSAKLKRLSTWNQERQAAAEYYDGLLAVLEVTLPARAPGNEHVWHLYTIRVAQRDAVLSALQAAGVGAAVHYPVPLHLQPALATLGYARGDFPVAEVAAETLLSLPLFPGITRSQQEHVAQTLADALP